MFCVYNKIKENKKLVFGVMLIGTLGYYLIKKNRVNNLEKDYKNLDSQKTKDPD